jgi:flotillin
VTWLVVLILAIIAVIVIIVFLNRFYVKSSRDMALIRTGAGGRRVLMDGGAVALPILHRVERMNMRTMRLRVDRS